MGLLKLVPCCSTKLLGDGDSCKVEESDRYDGQADGDDQLVVVADLDEPVDGILQPVVGALAPLVINLDEVENDHEDDGDQETKNAWKKKETFDLSSGLEPHSIREVPGIVCSFDFKDWKIGHRSSASKQIHTFRCVLDIYFKWDSIMSNDLPRQLPAFPWNEWACQFKIVYQQVCQKAVEFLWLAVILSHLRSRRPWAGECCTSWWSFLHRWPERRRLTEMKTKPVNF